MDNTFEIIEDCSPYYIRFTHPGIKDIIALCKEELKSLTFDKPFTHHILQPAVSEKILNMTPITNMLSLNRNRVSLFVTQPGYYYRTHKDGLNTRFSINYTVEILDNDCKTSWYDDSAGAAYEKDYLFGTSRELVDFDKSKHVPLKTMSAIEGECILFNTDLYHDFDNSTSKNQRTVLTLRAERSIVPTTHFDDVKQILFGGKI